MMPESEIGYTDKLVAFLDILGFRALVLQNHDRAEAVIRKLDDAIKHTLECLTLEGGPDWFSVKLFSDCFCISCGYRDLTLLLTEMSFLQWNLSGGGIFIRGGLSSGRHYENERIIFSEGLIRAYELQRSDPYPRILIDPVLVEQMRCEPSDFYRDQLLGFVLRGHDGVYFLDYLHCPVYEESGVLDESLEGHKDAILEQVALNRDRPDVVSKYRWLAEYHNFKFSEYYDEEDWVEGHFEALRDRILIPSVTFPSFERVTERERL